MPVVFVDEGLPELLDWMVRHAISGVPDLVFTLFVNDIVPSQATVLTDLARATFGGFQEVIMSRGGWTAPAIVGGVCQTTWGTVPTEWTVTGNPETIYGWAAYDFATMRLIFAERFDVQRVLTVGDVLGVLPELTLSTYVPCP